MGIFSDFRFFSSKFKLYIPVLKQYFIFCSLFYVNINGENSTAEIFRIYSDLKATICCFHLKNGINKLSFNGIPLKILYHSNGFFDFEHKYLKEDRLQQLNQFMSVC